MNIFAKVIALSLILFLVPALVFAKDLPTDNRMSAAFHTLSKMPTGEHAAPISMTDEQLNAVKGKLNLSSENLSQEIIASTQALVNQQLAQPIPKAESLRQEILTSTQALVNQGLSQLPPF